jgi:CheY-like chemotaxis protein
MKILIAEDDKDIVLLYKHTIEKRHDEVITSEDGEECLTIYHEEFQRARLESGTAQTRRLRLMPLSSTIK